MIRRFTTLNNKKGSTLKVEPFLFEITSSYIQKQIIIESDQDA
ncbi:hypothetical protein JCM19297_2664 [Nonlabens ulvanivorans]|nr:hypothetical protein JCM19297_2664 [Nonlabens ulvanivorans]